MKFSLLCLLFAHPVVFCIETGVIDIFVNHESHRAFINASLGLEHIDACAHQCDAQGKRKVTSFVKQPDEMVYTPNRRLQSDTVSSALEGNVQTGVILALGGHNGLYDFGPAGSLNGLMSVWDSWRSYFFTETSNTTSLILLLDERDFQHQNITREVGEYVDILLMKNMGASRVQCASASERRIVDVGSVKTDNSKLDSSAEKNKNKNKSSKPDIPKACSNVLGSLDQVSLLI
jgi:hypothetical protein